MTANITTMAYQLADYDYKNKGSTQKKSGHPTQPGNHSTAPRQPQRNRKQQTIIHQITRNVKRIKCGRIAVLCLAAVGAFNLIGSACGAIFGKDEAPTEITEIIEPAEPSAPTDTEGALDPTPEYIFRDGNGTPVDMQAMTNAWAAEAGYVKRYELTDAERWEVASVVTAEAVGEPLAGKVAVAQCILQACEDDNIRPTEAFVKYKYAKSRPEPTKEALEAVQAVFDFGQVATNEPIKYYYAPALVYSKWHESQDYVMTINGHRFFKEAE